MLWIVECAVALLAADFASGLVHWSEDTFGTESTPLLGRWIVAPNVLHHSDAAAFVSKGWLASSWDLALGGLIIAAGAVVAGHFGPGVVVFAVAGANANEIHKWNHAPARVPRIARWLWATGIMQRPFEHAQHHARGKNTAYCVLTPFVNPVLDALLFWRALERVVVPFVGAPRRDDLRDIPVLPWVRKHVW